MLVLRYFIVGKHSRGPVNEFHGDNCFCPVYQGKGCLAGGSIWRHSDRQKNCRQLINLALSTLEQPVKSLCPRASQYFSICPLRLAVTPWVRHGSETDLAAEVLDVLHEGVARELRAVEELDG